MRLFARLFTELDTTNKTAEKVAAMERYFRVAPPADAAWGLFFLSGLRLTRVVKTAVVRRAALEASGLPAWMLDQCYEEVGDLSETISLVLPHAKGVNEEPLHEVVERRIRPLVSAPDDQSKSMLLEAWAGLDRSSLFVFNKLIRGNFRIGVQRALVLRALAQATGLEAATLAHRFAGVFEPTPEAYAALIAPGGTRDDAARPYPFCLAHQLDVPVQDLGEPRRWLVEHKWDGIRAQILRREGLRGGVQIWSRGEEAISGQFPEIAAAARALPLGTVLDGELLAWRYGRAELPGRAMSFNTLQTRLNRKDVQASLFSAEGLTFMAFDLLEDGGRDLRGEPLRQRRSRLEEVLRSVAAGSGGLLRVSPRIEVTRWEEAEAARRAARLEHGAEGLMLKALGSRYHVGRVAGGRAETVGDDGDAGWWKWKLDPYSVDAVLIYAQQGSGRRAGLYTDYTFGVWDPDPGGELTPFAKAYSGLTNEEIAKVDAFVRANTVNRAGPVRMVRPELVFEISFEGIRASPRHRSGVAVRFPRITRWRTDKSARDADTIGSVRALLAIVRDDGSS